MGFLFHAKISTIIGIKMHNDCKLCVLKNSLPSSSFVLAYFATLSASKVNFCANDAQIKIFEKKKKKFCNFF